MAAPLVVPALRKHTATIIWAHGLGDSGMGWMPIAENFRRKGRFSEVAFIFPNAPNIPITVNFGMQMPGWYISHLYLVSQTLCLVLESWDAPKETLCKPVPEMVYDIVRPRDTTNFSDLAQAHDQLGILKSRDYFNGLIKAEIDKGIPSERIILGGFSQGGAISLFTGITCHHKLAGIFGLSSYLLLHDRIKEYVKEDSSNKDTPIFMGHGDEDPLVKPQWGADTAKVLRDMGWNVDLKTYGGLAHSADPREIDDLERYLAERLPPQT